MQDNNNTNGLEISWLDKPKKHNYKDACNYLKLLYSEKEAGKIVSKLEDADTEEFKIKDIARAAKIYHIIGDIKPALEKLSSYIQEGKPIAPILLVRQSDNNKLIIADGYHRACAIFLLDPCATVCCRIV